MGQRPTPERYHEASGQLAAAAVRILTSEGINPQTDLQDKEQARVIVLFDSPKDAPKEITRFAARVYGQTVSVRGMRVELVHNQRRTHTDAQLDLMVGSSNASFLPSGMEAIPVERHNAYFSTTIETVVDFGYKSPGKLFIDSEKINKTPGGLRSTCYDGNVGPQVMESAAAFLNSIPLRTLPVSFSNMLADCPSPSITRKTPSLLLTTSIFTPLIPTLIAQPTDQDLSLVR